MTGARVNGGTPPDLKAETERLREQFRRSQGGARGAVNLDDLDEIGVQDEHYFRRDDGSWQDNLGNPVDPATILAEHANKGDFTPALEGDALKLLTLGHWLTRDLPEPDFLLGQVISTTSRAFIIGPTGLGKTNFGLAVAWAIAAGQGFAHWLGPARPRRVLYIDGEMSRRGMRKRLRDACKRAGCQPDTLFVLNHEDFPNMEMLNTEQGQQYVNQLIDRIGGVDLIIFDNVQSLTGGTLKEEESWQETLPWVLDLTRREIGQIWVHHTGYDESHGYGTSTREWRMDIVMLLEKLEELPDGADLAFGVSFEKARERDRDNAADFETVTLTLTNDEWTVLRGDDQPKRGKPAKPGGSATAKKREEYGTLEDTAFKALQNAIIREGETPSGTLIPDCYPRIQCVRWDTWRRYFERVYVAGEDDDEKTVERRFREYANKLKARGRIGLDKPWVWIAERGSDAGEV